MALVNCKRCGRLFNMSFHDVCQPCIKEEDELFFQVRDYLQEHRRANIYDVNEATEVEVAMIIKWIREGRLATMDNPNLNFPCDSCGTPIQDGRYCKPCKDRLQKGLTQTKAELQETVSKEELQRARTDYFHKRR